MRTGPRGCGAPSRQSGLVLGDAGPPRIPFAGNIPYNPLGQFWPPFGYEKNDRWQFSTDLAWVRGRSTVKVGFEYRHHTFRHRGWAVGGAAGNFDFNRLETGGYDGAGNNLSQTGDPFASFLLGQVHDAFQVIYAQPTWYENYLSPWLNAEFKVNPKLTVTAGLRLDYQTARTEENDEYSTFDPKTPNPGAGNLPGAVIFAGNGPGRAGTRTFEDPKWDAWGPRVGFSYRVDDKTMVRGGYGMYYAGVAFSPVHRRAEHRVRLEPLRPEPDQRTLSRVPPRRRVPDREHPAAAVHRPHHRQRRRRDRGGARRARPCRASRTGR